MSHGCVGAADWLRAVGVSSAERQRHRAECLKDSQTRSKLDPQTKSFTQLQLCSATISLFTVFIHQETERVPGFSTV